MNYTGRPEINARDIEENNVHTGDITQTPEVHRENWEIYHEDYTYFDPEIHDEFLRNIHHQTASFAVFLTIWTCLINGLIISSCLRKGVIKHNGYYNQIANLSISNLLIGIFVIPLTIYHILNDWNLGQALCKIYVLTDIILPFTSVTIIIILNFDRLISIIHPRLYTWLFQKSLKPVVLITPWVVAFLVVVPLWTSGTLPYQNKPGQCIVLISKEAAILCPLLTFFFPVVIIIALTFKLILLRLQLLAPVVSPDPEQVSMKLNNAEHSEINNEISDIAMRRRPQSHSVSSTDDVKDTKDDVIALCVVNAIFAVMWFPYQSISFLLSFCHTQSCNPSIGLNQVVTWMGTASAGVVPLFWFIDCQMRTSLCSLCGRKRRTENIESSNSEETYV
jgi:hypothetical protein